MRGMSANCKVRLKKNGLLDRFICSAGGTSAALIIFQFKGRKFGGYKNKPDRVPLPGIVWQFHGIKSIRHRKIVESIEPGPSFSKLVLKPGYKTMPFFIRH